jgi:predicted nucleotidyltransferase component of viral defense system
VEQDLVISRVLVEIFSNRIVAEQAAFRGGTALQRSKSLPKNIDPVQKEPGPVNKRT